jgi:diaminohydroxyphosphoribosylaminopyrimidine deaminase / 5-amino-6-(5-phosphoribosylamino)uracil reductase
MSTRSSNRPVLDDNYWLLQAIELAREGMALAHPNPRVGAIVVKDGRKVGEGFHDYEKRDHAELVALKRAGKSARGAALYVSLEPCCTTGRTGPCTRAIIAAGIKKVYAPMKDPNPAVAGRGFSELKRAGIKVHVLERDLEYARETNEDFAKWIRTGLPFVTLKTALTLDGQIAQRAGSVTWITSKDSRAAVQRIRHRADALLTGIGTILADDPLLTDRSGLERRRRLLRVILDTRLRISPKSRIMQTADDDLLVFTAASLKSPKARKLQHAGVELVRLKKGRGGLDLESVLKELGRRDILSVLLEAGPSLNGVALAAGLVNKLILFCAPKIAGTSHVPFAKGGTAYSHHLRIRSIRQIGPDVLIEALAR